MRRLLAIRAMRLLCPTAASFRCPSTQVARDAMPDTVQKESHPEPDVMSDESPEKAAFYKDLECLEEGIPTRIRPAMLQVDLFPFQEEGVAWMTKRESLHTGGIMADHLGMGKTIQMLGLCLARSTRHADKDKKNNKKNKNAFNSTRHVGYRILTVVRQMQRINSIGNCSKLTRPGCDLFVLQGKVETLLESAGSKYDDLMKELEPWLQFSARYHPSFARRARAFLDDSVAMSLDDADTPELRTLIVVPAALMLQWQSEIEKRIRPEAKVSVFMYHGKERSAVSPVELESFDFVITSYDTCCLETQSLFHEVPRPAGRGVCAEPGSAIFDRDRAPPIFQVRWKRIILDEGHMIRHSCTLRWKVMHALVGIKKWVITATPLHNTIEDLQNVLDFVESPKLPLIRTTDPDAVLRDPILRRSISRSLLPVFLRRAPVMVRNGQLQELVHLPPKHEVLKLCQLTDDEIRVYNAILLKSRSEISSLKRESRKAMHVFAMMTRLRQVCCHPWLAAGRAVQLYQCGICKGEATDVVVAKCGHAFCHECLQAKFNEAEQQYVRILCPVCDFPISSKVFQKYVLSSHEHMAMIRTKPWQSSSKLDMLLHSIRTFLKDRPDEKCVIFSFFRMFLDIIAVAMERENIPFERLDGSMHLVERNATIHRFHQVNDTRVMLASKMAVGVGLNLTAATYVIVVDPWWNPAIEEQAVHRCHRIGQTREVLVERYVMSNTIEQHCYEISQRKKDFGEAILRAATHEDGDGSRKTEVAKSRLEELVSKLQPLSK